jgi:hypothetical protein
LSDAAKLLILLGFPDARDIKACSARSRVTYVVLRLYVGRSLSASPFVIIEV